MLTCVFKDCKNLVKCTKQNPKISNDYTIAGNSH